MNNAVARELESVQGGRRLPVRDVGAGLLLIAAIAGWISVALSNISPSANGFVSK